METTLGKRIMLCRKKLGLTQDKLAEAVGVTAQAVSKWENDQSCPDITLLPRLAELFGITTDELLGVTESKEESVPVLEGTVEDSSSGKAHKGFEFEFEPGKRDAIFFAAFILVVGILTLLSVLFELQISFWNILWPCSMLGFGIRRLLDKFSFFSITCSLFGIYFLMENMTITDLNVSWKLIFPVLILLLGLTLLVDSFKKPKHSHWRMNRSENQQRTAVNEFSVDGDTFTCSTCFGDVYRNVEMECLSSGEVDCAFGELTLNLCNCNTFAKDCHLHVDCSFGNTTIILPKTAQLEPSTSTAFAGLVTKGAPDPNAPYTVRLECDISFGAITVYFE